MKKLLLVLLFIFLTGCEDIMETNPRLDEQTRLEVLEKAKTDTVVVYIEHRGIPYAVKDGKIHKAAISASRAEFPVFIFTFLVCLLFFIMTKL